MSTASLTPFIQNTFTDDWTSGFPGQLESAHSTLSIDIPTFPAEGQIPMGRGVVEGTLTPTDPLNTLAPFAVKLPIGASVEADFVGIAYRPAEPTANVTNGNGKVVAGYINATPSAVIEDGNNVIVKVAPVAGIYADGDAVFMTVVESLPTEQLGQFSNSASANRIALTNLSWVGSYTIVTDDDNSIGRIRL